MWSFPPQISLKFRTIFHLIKYHSFKYKNSQIYLSIRWSIFNLINEKRYFDNKSSSWLTEFLMLRFTFRTWSGFWVFPKEYFFLFGEMACRGRACGFNERKRCLAQKKQQHLLINEKSGKYTRGYLYLILFSSCLFFLNYLGSTWV